MQQMRADEVRPHNKAFRLFGPVEQELVSLQSVWKALERVIGELWPRSSEFQ